MKKWFYIVCFFILMTFPVMAQDNLKPTGYLNDFAKIFDSKNAQKLEALLQDFERKSGNEVVVVTVKSLEGQDVAMYTYSLAERWKIGKKGKDNSVMILVSPNERKINISTGYGVEGVLTDALCKRIITEIAIPEFKQSNYAIGLIKSSEAVIKVLDGDYIPSKPRSNKKKKTRSIPFFILILIIIVILRTLSKSRQSTYSKNGRQSGGIWFFPFLGGGSNDRWGSGNGGGFGGGFGGFGGGSLGGGGASGGW